jgi:hypothetical protein
LPRVVLIDTVEEEVDGISDIFSLGPQLFRKLQIKVAFKVSRVPIVISNLIGDALKAVVGIEGISP